MNRFTRMLTMAGIGLVTGVTIGAGPAVASSSTDQGASRSESSARPWWGDNDRVVGFFRSYGLCDAAGEYGEDEGWWDESYCVRVPSGIHFRRYALVVQEEDWGHGWIGRFPGRYVGHWWPVHHGGNNWWPGKFHKPWFKPGRPGFPGFPGIPGRPHISGFPGNPGPQVPVPHAVNS